MALAERLAEVLRRREELIATASAAHANVSVAQVETSSVSSLSAVSSLRTLNLAELRDVERLATPLTFSGCSSSSFCWTAGRLDCDESPHAAGG